MTRSYTADEIRLMVTHMENCELCAKGDEDLEAELYDESLPAEELDAAITSSHSPAWLRFTGKAHLIEQHPNPLPWRGPEDDLQVEL